MRAVAFHGPISVEIDAILCRAGAASGETVISTVSLVSRVNIAIVVGNRDNNGLHGSQESCFGLVTRGGEHEQLLGEVGGAQDADPFEGIFKTVHEEKITTARRATADAD